MILHMCVLCYAVSFWSFFFCEGFVLSTSVLGLVTGGLGMFVYKGNLKKNFFINEKLITDLWFSIVIVFSSREKALQRVVHQWWPGHGPSGLWEQPWPVSTLDQQFRNRSRCPPTQHLNRDGLDGRGRPTARREMFQLSGEPQQLPYLWVRRGQ